MNESIRVQGRSLESADLEQIRQLVAAHPKWSRRRLSEVLCAQWDWRNGAGRLKDMATRSLLLKLESKGLIQLPARRRSASNRMASQRIEPIAWECEPIRTSLGELGPLTLEEVSRDEATRNRLAAAWAQFHYLGYRGTVGENLQYAITDSRGRLLASLLFGSAAWKCQARDRWIGWSSEQRARHLHLVTNNTRFLILPWVQVPHLASWAVGRVLRRLSRDWEHKYGHPIVLVETFVERERFAGTCYQAANWVAAGITTGRSRQDRDHSLEVPAKTVYVYPLVRDFRTRVCR